MSRLTPHQQERIDHLMDVIKGGIVAALLGNAGTGKTFCMGEVAKRMKHRVEFIAPTHKARAVLEEKTDGEAMTIHSALGFKPSPNDRTKFTQSGPVKLSKNMLWILDETSMVPQSFLDALLKAAKERNSKILLVGDPSQLPPVKSATVPFVEWTKHHGGPHAVVQLQEIVRQDAASAIPDIATNYRDTSLPFVRPKQMVMPKGSVLVTDPDEGMRQFYEGIKKDPNEHVFLSFTNAAVDEANARARLEAYGEAAKEKPFLDGETVVSHTTIMSERAESIYNSQFCEVVGSTLERLKFGETVYDLYRVYLRSETRGKEIEQEALSTTPKQRNEILTLARRDAIDKGRELRKALDKHGAGALWFNRPKSEQSRVQFTMFRAQHGLPKSLDALHSAEKDLWAEYYQYDQLLLDLRPPFAFTVHKSQGSTFGRVYIDFDSIARTQDRVPMLYTALTRSSGDAVVMSREVG